MLDARRLLILVSLSIAAATPAIAQQGGGPGASPHPMPSEPDAGSGPTEKGPNLDIPKDLSSAARSSLESAVKRWEAFLEALSKRGPKGLRGELDATIADLDKARRATPGCALAPHYLGIAYQLLGLYFEAHKYFPRAVARLKTAVKIKPDFHEAWVELGDAHTHVDQPKDAERAYKRAMKMAPDDLLAARRCAVLYLEQQRFEEAKALIDRALAKEPGDKALAGLQRKLGLVLDGPDWPQGYVVETKNYVIRTNASQSFAQKIADNAELIRRLYEKLFPKFKRGKRKFPIIVFGTKAEYHQNGGPPSAGGHYDPSFKQLFLYKYPKLSDTLLVLYHEGYHQFLDGLLETKPPQWFNEGVADFFGPSEYVNENGVEGMRIRPNPWRLNLIKRAIRQNKTVPFETLMNMTQTEMYGDNASLHYAQAWSIIYFLAEADDRAHFKYVKAYFKALRRGKSRREAYDAAFSKANMSALEQRWREFMLRVDG
jgi:tetratricopeptide (TPR) repeat protein